MGDLRFRGISMLSEIIETARVDRTVSLRIPRFCSSSSDSGQKSVLITGGRGWFGRKLAEILLKEHLPKLLIVYSRYELDRLRCAKCLLTFC